MVRGTRLEHSSATPLVERGANADGTLPGSLVRKQGRKTLKNESMFKQKSLSHKFYLDKSKFEQERGTPEPKNEVEVNLKSASETGNFRKVLQLWETIDETKASSETVCLVIKALGDAKKFEEATALAKKVYETIETLPLKEQTFLVTICMSMYPKSGDIQAAKQLMDNALTLMLPLSWQASTSYLKALSREGPEVVFSEAKRLVTLKPWLSRVEEFLRALLTSSFFHVDYANLTDEHRALGQEILNYVLEHYPNPSSVIFKGICELFGKGLLDFETVEIHHQRLLAAGLDVSPKSHISLLTGLYLREQYSDVISWSNTLHDNHPGMSAINPFLLLSYAGLGDFESFFKLFQQKDLPCSERYAEVFLRAFSQTHEKQPEFAYRLGELLVRRWDMLYVNAPSPFERFESDTQKGKKILAHAVANARLVRQTLVSSYHTYTTQDEETLVALSRLPRPGYCLSKTAIKSALIELFCRYAPFEEFVRLIAIIFISDVKGFNSRQNLRHSAQMISDRLRLEAKKLNTDDVGPVGVAVDSLGNFTRGKHLFRPKPLLDALEFIQSKKSTDQSHA